MHYNILNKLVVINLNDFWSSCPYCSSTQIVDDVVAVKCLDCGMGKYKEGSHKTFSKQMEKNLYPK
jgi:hypothetical protein